MKGKQPTVIQPNRSSKKMTKLSHAGKSGVAAGKAGNKHAISPGFPFSRNKAY